MITLSCFRAGIRNSIRNRNSNNLFLIFLEGFHKNLTQNPNFRQRILTDLTPCPRINENTWCKKCDFHFLNFRALNIYLCGKIPQILYWLFFQIKKNLPRNPCIDISTYHFFLEPQSRIPILTFLFHHWHIGRFGKAGPGGRCWACTQHLSNQHSYPTITTITKKILALAPGMAILLLALAKQELLNVA